MLNTFALFSQNCDLRYSGYVLDIFDGQPQVKALVEFLDSEYKVLSDENGGFTIEGICPGEYDLKISHPGCIDFFKKINIENNLTENIFVNHRINDLDEVFVEDLKQRKSSQASIEKNFTQELIQKFSSKNLADLVGTISGVSILKTGTNIVKPIINGVYGSRVLIVQDGSKIQDHEWGDDHAPSININNIDRLQLIKGAMGLQYGSAVGGIIKITPMEFVPKDTLFGGVSGSYHDNGKLISSSFRLNKIKENGLFSRLRLGIKNSGDFKSPDYFLTNSGHNEKSGSFSIGNKSLKRMWDLGFSFFSKELGILKSSHVGNPGDVFRALDSDVPTVIKPYSRKILPPKQLTVHNKVFGNYNKYFKNLSKINFNYVYQRNRRREFDIRLGLSDEIPSIDITLQTHDLNIDYESKKTELLSWKTGLKVMVQDNYSDPETGVKRLIPDYLRSEIGGYFLTSYVPSNLFQLEFGLRYDYDFISAKKYYYIKTWEKRGYNDQFQNTIIRETSSGQYLTQQDLSFKNLSSSLGLNFLISEKINGIMNIGLISRSPSPSELFSDGLHHSLATIEYGDLKIKNETAFKTSLSFEKNKGFFKWNINGYISNINDYILIEPSGIDQISRGAFQVWSYRQTDANFLGYDFDYSINIKKNIYLNGNFSWVWAKEKQNNLPIISIPPINFKNSLLFDNIFEKISFSIDHNYVGEQKRYPDNNFNATIFEDGNFVDKQVDISTPPKDYNLIGFSLNYNINDSINLTFDIENVLNESYRNYLNRFRYYADEPGRTVIIKLNYKF